MLEGMNSALDDTKEQISKLEEKVVEIIQDDQKNKNESLFIYLFIIFLNFTILYWFCHTLT